MPGLCRGGGTGIRSGLKIRRPQGLVGSSPTPGTICARPSCEPEDDQEGSNVGLVLDSIRTFLNRPGVRLTLAVVLACNLVLGTAYLWSRGGQTTHVRVEVRGNDFTVLLDGEQRIRARMPSAELGGIVVYAPNHRSDPATLPSPGRVEHVRVTSLDTGEILFEADEPPHPMRFRGQPLRVILDLAAMRWRNYAVDVTYRNVLEASFGLQAAGANVVTFRLDRGLHATTLTATAPPGDGEVQFAVANSELDAVASARGATATILRPYPAALVIASVLALMIIIMARLLPASGFGVRLRVPAAVPLGVACVFALAVFLIAAYILRVQLHGIPHVADEAAYLFQARLLASGRTHMLPPLVPEAFSFSITPFIIDYGGRWASFYTFGHPAALAPGALVGAPWVMPPLIAAANVLLIFGLGRKMFDQWTALLASALYVCSPFALLQASSFMSHNTAIAFMLASLFAIVALRERPYLAGALGGFFFGMFFNTRPLSAVMLVLPLGVLLLLGLLPTHKRASQLRLMGAFAVSALLMFVAYLAYNWSTTGEALQNGYQASGDLGAAFGFSGSHSVADGIDNEVWNIVVLIFALNAWPAWIGLLFVLMPFVLGTRNGYDWFLLGSALFIISGAAWFFHTGMVGGPRYLYEAVPMLLLLTARGITSLGSLPRRIAGANSDAEPTFTTEIITGMVSAAACALVAASALGWLLSSSTHAPGFAMPASARSFEGFHRLDDRLSWEADRLGLHDAIVVVRTCDQVRFCYLSVFLENDLSLNGDVVWVYDLGDQNPRVFEAYPCRTIYYATYASLSITPGGRTPDPPDGGCP